MIHTYTVIKTNGTVINNVDYKTGKSLCTNDDLMLTIKDNHVTAVRKMNIVDYNGIVDIEDTHLEKFLVNTPDKYK